MDTILHCYYDYYYYNYYKIIYYKEVSSEPQMRVNVHLITVIAIRFKRYVLRQQSATVSCRPI